MANLIEWRFTPGGVCLYGDQGLARQVKSLWWMKTPVTWLQAGQDSLSDDLSMPLTGLNLDEAIRLAKQLGGRLPTSVEWEWMAAGQQRRLYPWGDTPWTPSKANIVLSGLGRTSRVGSHPEGATPEGILDVAGNVWEWTISPFPGTGAIIRGGSYASSVVYIHTRFINAAPRELSSRGIGVRVVKDI
jgi:iron(II)-dependent oxidoreductase